MLLQVHGGAWMMGHKSEQAQPLLHRMVEMDGSVSLLTTAWPPETHTRPDY